MNILRALLSPALSLSLSLSLSHVNIQMHIPFSGKDYAMNLEIKKKTVCPDCLHPHRPGKFCHVFAKGRTDLGALDEEGTPSSIYSISSCYTS